MKTVRKNSKEFKAAVTSTGWHLSTLENNFSSEPIEYTPDDFDIKKGTMTKNEKGVLTLHVHSNLWYTKHAELKPVETIAIDVVSEKIESDELVPNTIESFELITTEESKVTYILEPLKQLAYNAYRNVSHHPDKRAESVVKDYSNELIEDLKIIPESEQERYKEKYISLLKSYLHSKSNTASSFITGGSNFPVERNRKRMAWADAKYNDFRYWRNRVLSAIERNKLINRTPEQKVSDEWVLIYKKIKRSAETIKNIDLGIERGYNRALFVSSITGLIQRLAKNGHTELVNRALDLIIELNVNSNKAIITLSNSIWKLRTVAEAKREEIFDNSQAENEIIPFEGGELIINRAADRVQIKHYNKPDQETISAIKQRAFKWSGFNKVWQRKYTPQALHVAKQLVLK